MFSSTTKGFGLDGLLLFGLMLATLPIISQCNLLCSFLDEIKCYTIITRPIFNEELL